MPSKTGCEGCSANEVFDFGSEPFDAVIRPAAPPRRIDRPVPPLHDDDLVIDTSTTHPPRRGGARPPPGSPRPAGDRFRRRQQAELAEEHPHLVEVDVDQVEVRAVPGGRSRPLQAKLTVHCSATWRRCSWPVFVATHAPSRAASSPLTTSLVILAPHRRERLAEGDAEASIDPGARAVRGEEVDVSSRRTAWPAPPTSGRRSMRTSARSLAARRTSRSSSTWLEVRFPTSVRRRTGRSASGHPPIVPNRSR